MMKRLLAIFVCMILAFGLVACGGNNSGGGKSSGEATNNEKSGEMEVKGETAPISNFATASKLEWGQEVIDGETMLLAKMEYPMIFFEGRDRETYPKLAEAVEKLNNELVEGFNESHKSNVDAAKSHFLASPDYFTNYALDGEITVRRADTNAVSFLLNTYMYAGGAHGNSSITGMNFDTETGKKLALGDVVNDVSALPEIIKEKLQLYWSDVSFFNLDDVDKMIRAEDEGMWILDYSGLTFYFEPYALAPYAAGTQVVTLSYEEYPELVKEKYRDIPKCYGVQLPNHLPSFHDVDGDGELENISCTGYNNEYGYIDKLTIHAGDLSYEDPAAYAYEYTSTFVHTEDGKNLLYVELEGDGGYRPTFCYELGEEITKLEEVGNGMGIYSNGQEDVRAYYALTNPERFVMSKRTDVLGTAIGNAVYYVNEQGLPRTDAVKYVFYVGTVREMNVLQDVTVRKYDEASDTVGEETVLRKGSKVKYFAADTNRVKSGYLRLEDGSVVKVQLDVNDGWARTIDGVDIEEIFDNIMFAG